MYLTSDQDLILVLGVIAAVLLTLSIGAGVLAAIKSFQVRQFQDLLFKAERKIDTLERRMFNVLNAVPVALVETDNSGKFTFANRSAHLLLGRKDNELIGLRFHSATWGITFPDGRVVPPDMMPIARTLRGQTVKGFQHLIVNHGTHEKVMVSVTSMPIMNGNGEVIGSTSAMVEIETTAGEGVGDLSGLWRGHWFTGAVLPFWGLDAKGQIIDVNNAALDAFEMKREDVIGKNWTQLFVGDADFQRAIDYLGDSQDATLPKADATVRLALTANGTETSALVSAWAVHTNEGGAQGLTVMAVPGDAPAPALTTETKTEETDMAFKPASELTDDDAQELEDLRNAEAALASLGIGVWQYDRDADAIVEDTGMQRLIGREFDGGPTLISEDDQSRADLAFADLLAGRSDALNLDIRVVEKDGAERWITLRGQAERTEAGERQIFGVAFDSTALKAAPVVSEVSVEPVADVDIDAIRAEALETARQEYEAELEKVRAEAATSEPVAYGWADAPVVDPAVAEENTELKARMERMQAELDAADGLQKALRQEIDVLGQQSDTIAPPVVLDSEEVPEILRENALLQVRLEAVQAELAEAEAYHGTLLQEIAALKDRPETADEAVADPQVAEDHAALKGRVETLQAELADAAVFHSVLQQQIEVMKTAPAPEPVVVREADPAVAEENETLKTQLGTVQDELAEANAAHDSLQQQIALLNARPEPVADTSAFDGRISVLEAQLKEANEIRNELQIQLSDILLAPKLVEVKDERDGQIEDLKSELEDARIQREALAAQSQLLSAKVEELVNTPPPEPDTSEWESKLAEAQFEVRKWQAAYDDTAARLAAVPPVDIDALMAKLENLQASLTQSLAQQSDLQASLAAAQTQQADMQASLAASQTQQADMQAGLAVAQSQQAELQSNLASAQAQQVETQNRLDQVSAALANARRFETVGRLTGDVAQDFAQMLNVINGALEVMSKQAGDENIKRLSDAALAAGKRGERLTRQLQAFQSEEYL